MNNARLNRMRLAVTMMWASIERMNEGLRAREDAAMANTCACGAEGSWEHPVFGTTGTPAREMAWAGCPEHRGTAVGAPRPVVSDVEWQDGSDETTTGWWYVRDGVADIVVSGTLTEDSGRDEVLETIARQLRVDGVVVAD